MASSVIAIGDELLGGFTQDTNSHWLAGRLRLLGRPLKRISTVRDIPAEIVQAVRRDLADPDLADIFCSGGLGPTPDDRTFEAIAAALGRELVVWEEARVRIERRVARLHEAGLLDSRDVTEGNLRMARIPARPLAVLGNRRGMAPSPVYEPEPGRRLFVLPGVPPELKGIFTEEIEPRFLQGGSPATVRELRFTHAAEARFYPVMREVEAALPAVSIGSYPNFETRELVIRCLGADPAEVGQAIATVRRRAQEMGLTPAPGPS